MTRMLPLGVAAVLALSACGGESTDQNTANTAQTGEAADAAGDKTIASGINQNGRFFQSAKAAGLDATLAGPGPYTVLVPDDAAFAAVPPATSEQWARPEARAELTTVLTYHILPGTVLAEDIGKAIDNSDGTAILATMGGGTLSATREGGNIVLTDGSGTKATVTKPDERYTNGVVHHINAVLQPQQESEEPPAG